MLLCRGDETMPRCGNISDFINMTPFVYHNRPQDGHRMSLTRSYSLQPSVSDCDDRMQWQIVECGSDVLPTDTASSHR